MKHAVLLLNLDPSRRYYSYSLSSIITRLYATLVVIDSEPPWRERSYVFMRRACWYVSMVLLLVSLASCGTVSQNQQRARVSIATPTPTTTASNSSASLNVPAQPVPTRTATPTPRPSNNHAVPAQTGGSAGSGSQLEQQLFHLINQD